MNAVLQKISFIPRKAGELMERRRWLLPSVFSLILFAVAIWGIENFNQLLLYDDEFGYWTASAYLTGTDWTSVTSGIPYYSYGYGFLILTPIRLLMSTPELMYQAAIVVNGLLLVGSYWIARNVSHQLFEDAYWALIDVVCFVVMLYPSNLVFSHIAWAECTLVFIFWVFVWTSLRVIKKPSLLNHVGLACNVMCLYAVHQRTLAVAIATVMVMAWCFWTDKSRRKNIIWFAVVMVVLMVVHSFIKNGLIDDFYYNNTKVTKNNLGGQKDNLLGLLTGEGLLKLIKSAIGKWLYLFIATYMMAWWGAEFLFSKAKFYFKSFFAGVKKVSKTSAKKGSKKDSVKEDVKVDKTGIFLWYVWMLLAFAGNFMILAISMGGGGRNDVLLYGRYIEYMIGIYFIMGILTFLKDEKWLRKTIIYVLVGIVFGWICQKILNADNTTGYQAYHSISTSLFLEKGTSAKGAVLGFVSFGISVSMIIMLLMKSRAWKKVDWIRKCLIVCPIIWIFITISSNMVFGVMSEKQLLRIINIRNIVEDMSYIDEDHSQKVYYCSDTESRYWSESFQFLMADTPLTVIKSDQIDIGEDAFYIVGNGFLYADGFDDYFYCIRETNQFALVVSVDSELAEVAREIKGE